MEPKLPCFLFCSFPVWHFRFSRKQPAGVKQEECARGQHLFYQTKRVGCYLDVDNFVSASHDP